MEKIVKKTVDNKKNWSKPIINSELSIENTLGKLGLNADGGTQKS